MFPMWATQGWLQPFRFVDLTEANRDILDVNLRALLHPADEKNAGESPLPQAQATA
jgi:hypothetical protein